MTDQLTPDETARAQITSGLRQLADYLDTHPAIPSAVQLGPARSSPTATPTKPRPRRGRPRRRPALGGTVRDDTADGGHYTAARVLRPDHLRVRPHPCHAAGPCTATTCLRQRGHRRCRPAGGLMTPPRTRRSAHTQAARQAGACSPFCCAAGSTTSTAATGELLHRYTTAHEPGGVLPVACKTRRASRCLPCAETYRYDTYQLIRAGLTGGKGVPDHRRRPPGRVPHAHRPLVRRRPHPPRAQRPGTGLPTPPQRQGLPARAPAVVRRPARAATTPSSASRSARTATTTPDRSCSTPALPSCGAGSPSPCAAPSPARPG